MGTKPAGLVPRYAAAGPCGRGSWPLPCTEQFLEVARADSSHFPDEEPRQACRSQEMGEELRAELGHTVSAQAAEALERQWDGRAPGSL